MARLIVIFLVCLTFIVTPQGFANNQSEGMPMQDDPISSSVAEALKNANKKVRELGHDIEKFHITITEQLDDLDMQFFSANERRKSLWKAIKDGKYSVWKIYYGPKAKPSMGGDITVYVNRKNGEILEVWEGE